MKIIKTGEAGEMDKPEKARKYNTFMKSRPFVQ
jgi:hypothetical protein